MKDQNANHTKQPDQKIQPGRTSQKKLAFLCSPNLAILDNWTPVLHQLKEKKDQLSISFILPKVRYVREIEPENILFRLTAGTFDSIIFKNDYGRWLRADDYGSAKKLVEIDGFERTLLRLSKKLGRRKALKLFGRLLWTFCRWINGMKTRRHRFDFDSWIDGIDGLLYDIAAEGKSYNRSWLRRVSGIPKFSISHGLNLNDGRNISLRPGYLELDKDPITAFVFSKNEMSKCKAAFALEEKHMELVGIPRHDPAWMDFIISEHQGQKPPLENYVFVISRPHSTKYHPRERMKKSLEDIRTIVMEDLGMNVIVKLHPKEYKTGIYEEVFGSETEGKRWAYSNLHPYILGRDCNFAVCFESGVALDMILLDVPIIARLDLRGIPEFDNKAALRDSTGDPVFIYRYLGFNLGASSYDQMKNHIDAIISDREEVMAGLRENYYTYFVKSTDSRTKISSKILNSIFS